MKKKRKIIVSLACRVDGTRLFAKPLQNLGFNKKRRLILDIIIGQLLTYFKKKILF